MSSSFKLADLSSVLRRRNRFKLMVELVWHPRTAQNLASCNLCQNQIHWSRDRPSTEFVAIDPWRPNASNCMATCNLGGLSCCTSHGLSPAGDTVDSTAPRLL